MAEVGLTAQLELQAQTQRFEQQVKAAIGRINPVRLQIDASRNNISKITGDFSKFNQSLDQSNARILSFGASTAVIFGIQKAFRELIRATIDVEKSLTDINVILNLSQKSLNTFGNSLFEIAKNTGKSFKDVSIAATEFSRQGLGASETLKRTRDALILTRLAGLDTADSVKALTTAINSFSSEALDSSVVLNKLAAVDAKFAVSSKDLAESLQRVGSTAADAGVNLDELLAIVTTVAQTTGRGGAVIGNAFKTIFTRIQRPETLNTLEELGVGVRDLEGNIRPALGILTALGKKYDDLSASQRQQVDELTAGVFQINVFKAAISNLGKPLGTYDQALKISVNATDEAFSRIKELNQTLSDQFNRTVQSITEAGAKIGTLAFKNPLSNILSGISGGAGSISEILDGEGVGAKFAQGLIKGIGNVLAGPGLIVALGIIGKIALRTFSEIGQAGKNILALTQGSEARRKIEEQINFILLSENENIQRLISGYTSEIDLANRLLIIQREILATRAASAATVGAAANIIIGKGQGKLFTKATGHVPNAADGVQDAFIREQLAINQGVGGASRGARPVLKTLNLGSGPSPAVVNSDEKIIRNFAGTGQDAVFNKSMIRQAGGNLQRFGRIENVAGGLKYPIARGNQAQNAYPQSQENWKYLLKNMSPQSFLDLTLKLTSPDAKSLANLRNRMLNGLPIDAGYLQLRSVKGYDNPFISGHEGRHRATVAKELGIEDYPVHFDIADFGRVSQLKPEELQKIIGRGFYNETGFQLATNPYGKDIFKKEAYKYLVKPFSFGFLPSLSKGRIPNIPDGFIPDEVIKKELDFNNPLRRAAAQSMARQLGISPEGKTEQVIKRVLAANEATRTTSIERNRLSRPPSFSFVSDPSRTPRNRGLALPSVTSSTRAEQQNRQFNAELLSDSGQFQGRRGTFSVPPPDSPTVFGRAKSFASNRLDIRRQNLISEGTASRFGQGAFAAAFLGPILASSFGASEKQQKNISDLSGNLGIAGIAASLGKGPIGVGAGIGIAAGSIGKFALAQLDPDFEKLAKEAGELAERFNQQNESINNYIAAQSNLTEALKSGNPSVVKRASEASFQAEQGLSIGDRAKFVGKTFDEREAARNELNKKQAAELSSKSALAGLAKNSALGGDIVASSIFGNMDKLFGGGKVGKSITTLLTGGLNQVALLSGADPDKRFFSGSDENKERARKFAEEFVRGGGTQKTLSAELSNAGVTLTNKEDELEIRRNIELYSKLNAVLEDKQAKEKEFNTSIAGLNKQINALGGKLKFLAEFDNLKKDNTAKLGIQGARGRINTFSSFFSEEQLAGFEGGLDNLDIERESRKQVNDLLADFKDSMFDSIKDANLSQTSKGRDFGKALIERTLKGEYNQGDIAAKLKSGILEFEQQGVKLSDDTKRKLEEESDILAQKLSVQGENLKYQKAANDLATKQKQELIRVNNALKSFGGVDQFLDRGARQKSIGDIIGGARNAGRRLPQDIFSLRNERNQFAPTAEGQREFDRAQSARSADIGRGQLTSFRSLSQLFPGDAAKPFIEKLSGVNRGQLAKDIAFSDTTDINSIQKSLFSDFSGTQAFQTRGSGFQNRLSSFINQGTPEGIDSAILELDRAQKGARNSQLSPNDVEELRNIKEQLEALKGLSKTVAGSADLKSAQALGLPTKAGEDVIKAEKVKVEAENQRNDELFKAATSTATNTKSIEGILEQIRQLQAVANANLEKITGPKEGENSRFTQGEVKGSIEFNQKVQGEVIVKLDQNGQVQVTDEGARKKIDEIMAQLRKMGIVFTPSTPAPVLGVRG